MPDSDEQYSLLAGSSPYDAYFTLKSYLKSHDSSQPRYGRRKTPAELALVMSH